MARRQLRTLIASTQFFEGSLADALAQSQAKGRSLLVWLHGQRGLLTDTLVQKVWNSEECRRLVQQNQLLCWAGDVWRSEPYEAAVALGVQRFPVVALLRPAPSSQQPSAASPRAPRAPPAFVADVVLQGEVQARAVLEHLRRGLEQQRAQRQLREMAQALLQSADAQRQATQRMQEQRELLAQQEAEESPLVIGLYESQYGENHPEFLDMSFEEAIAEAKRQDRLLLAWLRSSANAAADEAFGARVWPSEVVQAFVREHYLVWAGDVDRWLGPAQLRQVLQLPAAPALVVMQPASVYEVDSLGFLFGRVLEGQPCEHPAGTAWQVLGHLDASCAASLGDGEPVVDFLCAVGERREAERYAAEAERLARQREREERQQLREAQDAEFQESLRIDAERCKALAATGEAPTEATKEAPARGPAAVAAASCRAAEAKEPSALELRRRAAAAELRLKDEAQAAPLEGELCRLVVRLPSGRRLERVFRADERVAAIYSWADCAAEYVALAKEGGADARAPPGAAASLEVPEHFLLCVTFPRQPLTDHEMDLKTAGLCPNAVLALSATDPP